MVRRRGPDIGSGEHARQIAVDRMAGDLRRGLPVILYSQGFMALAAGGEELRGNTLDLLREASKTIVLAVTAARAEALKSPSKGREVVCLSVPDDCPATEIAALADPTRDLSHPLSGPYRAAQTLPDETQTLAAAALALCRRASLLPAAVLAFREQEDPGAWAADRGFLALAVEDIGKTGDPAAAAVHQVAAARLPLAVSEDTRILAFRPADGGDEHLALVIGSPNTHDPVLVRIHSACFTGDILGSLKCDCGTQLQAALQAIADQGSGILLYMDQEGRGIGLLAKLKAYALQDQGFDTVDANLRLGFAVDERSFVPAAAILKALGYRRVRLLTNNPEKVRGLEAEGIEVIERVPHDFPPNRHNEAYLEAKKRRTGHLL